MRCAMFAGLLALMSGAAFAQTRVDSINTNFRWFGPDDKIVVERYDDPRVENVSCYLSRAETGGIKGGLGFAEDPSRFSIACRALGPVSLPASMPKMRNASRDHWRTPDGTLRAQLPVWLKRCASARPCLPPPEHPVQ